MIEDAARLAKDIKKKIVEKQKFSKRPRVVFDLDGTLIYYFPRTRQILIDAARMIPEIPEETIKNIDALDLDDFPYWLNMLLDKIEIHDPAVRQAFLKEWDDRFFTDQYLWADRAMKGATDFVRLLSRAGVITSYLTGRHRNGMYLGTRGSILRSGFPFDDSEIGLLMKPLKEHSNALFKKAAAEKLAASGEVIAVFDNEPQELANIAGMLPDAIPVLYVSPCSSNVPLDDRFYKIDSYRQLIDAWSAAGE